MDVWARAASRYGGAWVYNGQCQRGRLYKLTWLKEEGIIRVLPSFPGTEFLHLVGDAGREVRDPLLVCQAYGTLCQSLRGIDLYGVSYSRENATEEWTKNLRDLPQVDDPFDFA